MDHLTAEDVQRIAKADKKAILPATMVTLFLTLAGWAYGVGVLAERVDANTKLHEERTDANKAVPVIQNEIQHIKTALDEGLQRVEARQESFEEEVDDLKDGQNDIKLLLRDLKNGAHVQ